MAARNREKTTLPSNCRATYCGALKRNCADVRQRWGGPTRGWGEERIAASMARIIVVAIIVVNAVNRGAGGEATRKAGLAECSDLVLGLGIRQREPQHFTEKMRPFMGGFRLIAFLQSQCITRRDWFWCLGVQ